MFIGPFSFKMKVLLVGENSRGAAPELIYNNLIKLGVDAEIININDFFRTSFLNRILNKLLKIPHYFGPGVKKINEIVLKRASEGKFNFVLFLKPLFIYPETIVEIKKYSKVIGLYNDYVAFPKNNSDYFYKSLPLFDSYLCGMLDNIEIMRKLGVKRVKFFPVCTADSMCHYPVPVSDIAREKLGADVAFLGTYANEKRAEYLERLCKEGYDVKIYGNSWHNLPWNSCLRKKGIIIPGNTPCEKMSEIIGASKIILSFMREHNHEVIACRSWEIPLCGGFMLHQRTKQAESFLEPDKEAVFFDAYEEMKEKIDFYLKNEELRKKIAEAGRQKILNCKVLSFNLVKELINFLENFDDDNFSFSREALALRGSSRYQNKGRQKREFN